MIWADGRGWAVWSQRRGNRCLETGILKKETATLSVKSFPAELVKKSKSPCHKHHKIKKSYETFGIDGEAVI